MVGCLFDYNVKPGPDLIKVKARLAKARFGQVGDQVGQVKVGQSQSQELDNLIMSVKVLVVNSSKELPLKFDENL